MASDSRPERTRDAARTKQRLLDAACDEFAKYGIAGGRVERIAAAARCNKALIYAYFDSKDALFDAAADRGVQFVKGSDFVLEGYESTLRLAYSGVTPAEIDEGVSRLAQAYEAVTGEVTTV